MMKKLGLLTLVVAVLALPVQAEDVVYRKSKVADAKGKQVDADLVFKDSAKLLSVQVADRPLAQVPYSAIDKLTYDYAKKHRIAQGAIVMVASLGAGAVVMLTKSKSHWFTVDYHEDNVPKAIVLRLDKKEYQKVLVTAKSQTGKEITYLKDAKLKK